MPRWMAILIIPACCLGCRDSPRASPFLVRDSAGVRIVERTPGMAPPERIVLVEVPFSAQLPEFGDILDVAPAPDGRLVVLDPLGPHVVVLDSTGAESSRFGGEGDGPGRFRGPGLTELVVLGDTVAVPDVVRQRVTLFGLDGRVLETLPVPASEGLAVDWRGDGEHRLIFRRVSAPQRLEALTVGPSTLEVVIDFARLSLPSEAGPLTPLPLWCRLADGRLVVARTDDHALRVLREGVLTTLLKDGSEGRPITESDLEHLQGLLRRSVSRRLGLEVPAPRVRQLLEQTPLPEQAPRLAELRCSSDDEVWVQRALPVPEMGEEILRVGSTQGWGASAWDVFGLESETLRRVDLPVGTQITRVTEHSVVGYTTDEYGRKSPARWRRE